MNARAPHQPPSDAALDQAAHWFVTLHAGDASEQDQQRWRLWLDANPENARAWACANGVGGHFKGLPSDLARATLSVPAGINRRRAIQHLALLIGVGGCSWLALREQPWQRWTADYRTGLAERGAWRLADGSLLSLNSASAVTIAFTPHERLVNLLEGELLLETGRDPRPLRVSSAEGSVRPIGTRFSVSQDTGATRVAVFSGSVLLTPGADPARQRQLHSGQAARLYRTRSDAPTAASEDLLAWLHGMLIADEMPLSEFASAFERQRRGRVTCAAAVASLRISGAFPLNDSDRALDALAANLPVRIRRFTRYWVHIEPR